MTTLHQEREHIAGLDRRILALAAERMEAARAIGEYKKSAGLPLRDWEMEKQVLLRAATFAEELGISSNTARSLMRTLISESRAQQEQRHYSTFEGRAETVLVIGGAGKMGRWFERFLLDQGHRVFVFDPRAKGTDSSSVSSLSEGLSACSVAIVAVPLSQTAEVIEELVEAEYRGVIVDIASLKSPLRCAIDRARDKGLAVTSFHPMFGPGTRMLSDHVVCICDCGHIEATAVARKFFEATAVTLVEMTLEDHDRMVTYVLGLSHLVNVLFADVLARSGLASHDLIRMGSTTYQSQMTTASAVMHEDPSLYHAIQRVNPHSTDLYDSVSISLDQIRLAVKSGQVDTFAAIMKRACEWNEGTTLEGHGSV